MTRDKPPQPTRPLVRQRPTIQDIADEAGVSKGLVSLILNGKPGPSAQTTARVLKIADQLRYRTNRTASLLARRRTHTLGVTMNLRNPLHTALVEDLQRAGGHRGYEVTLATITPSRAERHAIETLLDLHCDALLLLSSELPEAELQELTGGIPVVSVGRPITQPGFDVVRTADHEGMALLIDHLVELGHRHITHVDGGDGFLSAARRHAYTVAMRRHQLHPTVIIGGETEREGVRAAHTLRLTSGVTAVVAYNDRCAVGILDHHDRAGITVPDQMSVTGYDNALLAHLHRIRLTTISQSPGRQARLAVAAAIERLDSDRAQNQHIVLQPHLIIRRTTAAAPR